MEEYSSKINRLIGDMKYNLIIPRSEVYDEEVFKKICENWEQALSKLKEAQEVVQELLRVICAERI